MHSLTYRNHVDGIGITHAPQRSKQRWHEDVWGWFGGSQIPTLNLYVFPLIGGFKTLGTRVNFFAIISRVDNFDIWQNSHVNFRFDYAMLWIHLWFFGFQKMAHDFSNSEATKNGSTKSRLGNLRRFFKHGSKSLGDAEVIATTTGWTLHYVKRRGPTFGAYWCWPGYRQVLPHRRWFFVEICWKLGVRWLKFDKRSWKVIQPRQVFSFWCRCL